MTGHGDHLFGKTGNVRDFDSSQGKVAQNCCIFASVWVLSSIQLLIYAFIIMKSLCCILIIDNNTRAGTTEHGRSAANHQGFAPCLESK